MIYVRVPSDKELQEIKRMTRQEVVRVAQRAQMIPPSAQQRTVPEIARISDLEYKKVYKWMRRFNVAGPAGLYDEPRWRPAARDRCRSCSESREPASHLTAGPWANWRR
jgi:hypothetical protein